MNIRKITLYLLPMALCLGACKKFLDVSASSQVLEEDMFATGDGIHIAVNGVYKILSSTQLYGKNLSWGLASALGYNYSFYSLPYTLQSAADFDWEDSYSQEVTEEVWDKAYNAVANCNNIIQEVGKKDDNFFKQGINEKNMILAEMYGVRAMVHFDLLRLFSPAPATGYTGTSIPYVTAYPSKQPQHLSMSDVLSNIINDMQKAKDMLGSIDTTFITVPGSSTPIIRYTNGRIRNSNSWYAIDQGDFFNYRGERMNYFAATALLARIYLYKGDYVNAEKNARIIYNYQKKGWFTWTNSFYQGQITDVDYIYTKKPDELLLSFSNNKNYDNWDAVTITSTIANNNFRMNDMADLFGSDLDDYRLVGWYNRYGDQRYLTWARPKGTSDNAKQLILNQGPLLPIIRFSEMYHVLIECDIRNGNLTEAVNLLNVIRTNRGAKVKIASSLTAAELMKVMENDIIRETLTEGQTFYMFKRLNINIYNGEVDRIMQPKDWYAPIPISETDYQF